MAIMRYKLNIQRDFSIGGEGIFVITVRSPPHFVTAITNARIPYQQKRTLLLSLPLVFLAYALIALIVGVVLYSFWGTSSTDVEAVTKQFEEYTRWMLMGTLGGIVVVMAGCSILARR